jgi:hypothetical protein
MMSSDENVEQWGRHVGSKDSDMTEFDPGTKLEIYDAK